MTTDQISFERIVIHERATATHDERCARGFDCGNRDWHISNDYLHRAQHDRVAELQGHLQAARQALRAESEEES